MNGAKYECIPDLLHHELAVVVVDLLPSQQGLQGTRNLQVSFSLKNPNNFIL